MEVTRLLTEFQQSCEKALCAALAAEGFALAGRNLAGETETYIHASVRDTDMEVYIYEDEAQFHRGGRLAGLYEHQEFDDAHQLQAAFVSGVMKALQDN